MATVERIDVAELATIVDDVAASGDSAFWLLGRGLNTWLAQYEDSWEDHPNPVVYQLRGEAPGMISPLIERLGGSITHLSLCGLGLDDVAAHGIAGSLAGLTALNLSSNRVGIGGAQAIAQSLTNLTTLKLDANQVGDAGAQAIAQSLTNLTELYLGSNQVGDAGAQAIAQSLTNLTTLNLAGNQVGEAGAQAIAQSLTDLTTLYLNGNLVGEAGAQAIAQSLTNLTTLNLAGSQVGEAGARAIAQSLTNLTELYLYGDNAVGEAGARAIAQSLTNLTTLYLSSNRVGDAGAHAIAQSLTNLTALDLMFSGIGEAGARAIAESLTNLTELYLYSNQVRDAGAHAIAQSLTNLTTLYLNKNQVGDAGAHAIAQSLTNLTTLKLDSNQIGDAGAHAIAQSLTNLTDLDLGSNQIGEAGAQAIAQSLTNLTTLDLDRNQIGDAGAQAIAQSLTNLTELHLHRTQFGDAGTRAIAQSLTNLTTLDISDNPAIIESGPLANLQSLNSLNLSETSITDLAPLEPLVRRGLAVTTKRYHAAGISVEGCPLKRPPLEVVVEGRAAVLNYFDELRAQGVDRLFEAKVLILGPGGSGKTSLLRRLYKPGRSLPTEDESTKGIDVHRARFEQPDGTPFHLNVWDFGGQQIYHATHQFFLTKSSLYVLVDDTRKDDKSVHDPGFKYWLEAVEALSDRSPVLIFQNEKGRRTKKIDEPGIKGRFPNVLHVYGNDLADSDAAVELRSAIEHFVQTLPHVGEELPAKWIDIRGAIEDRAAEGPTMTLSEYFELYGRHLEPDRDKALHLSRYLHDLGVFLHFQDDYRLRSTIILKNKWATDAVFKLIEDESVKARQGRFTEDDAERIWSAPEYADLGAQLLGLVEKFELCYAMPDTSPRAWLAPQLLSPSVPAELGDWGQPGDLVRNYRYEFLPKGLVNRLMVRLNRCVARPDMAWASGVLFEQDETRLLAQELPSGDEIALRARGPDVGSLMAVVASELDALNDTFRGLEGSISVMIPCRCHECTGLTDPHLFEEAQLRNRRRRGRHDVECEISFERMSVSELLDGLEPPAAPAWAARSSADTQLMEPAPAEGSAHDASNRPDVVTVEIFLASSEELESDRNEFDLHVRRLNDRLLDDGLYLKVVRWEHFLDAMSETRLQGEYNMAVERCDLFVSLFRTKTGRYTEEEFDVAHRSFQETGRPQIFTFFRKAQVGTDRSNRDALQSLWEFQDKLAELGHFYTEYTSPEDLKLRFQTQLELLRDAGTIGRSD